MVVSKSYRGSAILIAVKGASLASSSSSMAFKPGRNARRILRNASLQSLRRYFAFREYIRTTPKRRCPDVLRANFT